MELVIAERKCDFQQSVFEWSRESLESFPWRYPSRTPFEILIAEVLLKRTTARAAANVYQEFLDRFPTIESIATASVKSLAAVFSRVGLQQQRARAAKALALHLVEVHNGDIPNCLSSLLSVPGLGEYSARAIMSFGHNTPVAVLDTNVERILHRVFLESLPERPSREQMQELANCLLSHSKHRQYNFGLLDLGRQICRYVEPRCGNCPLASVCDFFNQAKATGIRETPGRYHTGIAEEVKTLRLDKGLSLQRLAEAAGVSKLTVIRIEAGRSSPRRETLAKLAQALNVSIEELI